MEQLAPLLGRTLIIVAHPDDEAVCCGALLQRVREPLVLFCTDGAPRDPYFWQKFGSRAAYARLRRQEARRALAQVGVSRFEFLAPEDNPQQLFADQDLFLNVPAALERIAGIVRHMRPEALLTMAYEGGHPDHDTCAFLTWWTAREHILPAWEMPGYHRAGGGQMVFQQFIAPEGNEVLFDATPQEAERKRAMLAEYPSQGDMTAKFNPAVERYRPQAAYDFALPPHPGTLNYEAWQWSVTGSQLVQAFTACLDCHLGPPEPERPGSSVRGMA
jgi:LmbE family N-acetylglucosaminyl deacetylase